MEFRECAMAGLEIMIDNSFWQGKRVFITGHTGFKGSWLSLLLTQLGAKIKGYALAPPTTPSLFVEANIAADIESEIADIRDLERLTKSIKQFSPEIVIHLAAQPLVRDSYQDPLSNYSTNLMGTVNLFEAIKQCNSIKAVVNVTTDKCYENNNLTTPFKESAALGGYDPYSASKACSEIITASYQRSFFSEQDYHLHHCAIATARAGNVIGGGDWAKDRLLPDMLNALSSNSEIILRNPHSVRPWQHVLEPLSGYLILAEKLFKEGPSYNGAWNFGPHPSSAQPVQKIAELICSYWGGESGWKISQQIGPHEASYLSLDCNKAQQQLAWQPKWSLQKSLQLIVNWQKSYSDSHNPKQLCIEQINEFLMVK